MLVVDVETSGLDPNTNTILSIGAIDFNRPERQFYQECQLLKGSLISQQALQVNGYTIAQITDSTKKSLGEILFEFIGWVEKSTDKTIAGQNPTFDRDFLNSSCRKCNIEYAFSKRTVDMHAVCYAAKLRSGQSPFLQKGVSSLVSDRIMHFVGIPAEPKPHIAINGAKYEAEAFKRLIYGRCCFEEFAVYPVPEYLRNNAESFVDTLQPNSQILL